MKTPRNYIDNLKKGVITEEMLENVLFSYNKRAKNYRDKERQYRAMGYCGDLYNNETKNRGKKECLYKKKEDILKCNSQHLKCIHQLFKTADLYVYDDEESYNKICKKEILWEGDDYDPVKQRNVKFRVVNNDVSLFFLYYEFKHHSFHTPISKEDLGKYKDVEIIKIDNLVTKGKNIRYLLSCQFCDKVYNFIMKNGRN